MVLGVNEGIPLKDFQLLGISLSSIFC